MHQERSHDEPLYELKDAGLCTGDGALLRGANLRLRDRAITVIVGPAGVGKSALLSMLAGRPAPGIAPTGMWRCRGEDLCDGMVRAQLDVVWSPQRGRSNETPRKPPLVREAIEAATGRLLLLDEPTIGHEERDACATTLRHHATSGAAIVVTHDLQFARAIADDVCLVCAGRIEAVCSASEFFETPPTVLCARFVRMGNCWPPHPAPPLPNHFRWVLPGKLSGMGRPGLLAEEDDDLAAIANAGIGYLVSLTEEPFSPAKLRAMGIIGRHFPIADMGIPALGPTAHLCRSIQRWMDGGERVTVHCHAGLGRTGTILAATLVWLGQSADDALASVRAAQPMYVQTLAQRDFVRRFAEAIR